MSMAHTPSSELFIEFKRLLLFRESQLHQFLGRLSRGRLLRPQERKKRRKLSLLFMLWTTMRSPGSVRYTFCNCTSLILQQNPWPTSTLPKSMAFVERLVSLRPPSTNSRIAGLTLSRSPSGPQNGTIRCSWTLRSSLVFLLASAMFFGLGLRRPTSSGNNECIGNLFDVLQ